MARPVSRASFAALARLYALDVLLMAALAMIAALVTAAGFDMPDNMLEDIRFTPGWIALIVLAAPLIEELVFRSWLSGRPGHVLAAALMLGAAGIAAMVGVGNTGEQAEAGVALAALGGAFVGAIAIFLLRRRPAMGWFQRIFPVLFWVVTLAFGVMHIFNYESASLAILLPLALPQIIAGALFGYARVQYGLWAAVLFHTAHNSTALGIALLAERLGG